MNSPAGWAPCNDVMIAMREHGVDKIADVQTAVLKTDGSIGIVPLDAKTLRTGKRVRAIRRGP